MCYSCHVFAGTTTTEALKASTFNPLNRDCASRRVETLRAFLRLGYSQRLDYKRAGLAASTAF
jgi:hypothetical protein